MTNNFISAVNENFSTLMFAVLAYLAGAILRIPLISAAAGPGAGGGGGYMDPRFKRVLWYLIGSTKGGVNRAKIIDSINSHPANANQIATELKLDYKTVLHHLRVLSDNGLIITENKDSYGTTYFLTPLMEKNYSSFTEILARIGKK
jgi:DNA-binding transcriptional ArsR family regulator